MNRKPLLLIAALAMAITCAAGFAACGENDNGNSGNNGGTQTPQNPPAHTHSMTHHGEVAAECTADGTKEYWSCSGCQKNFADENGNTEIMEISVPALGHDFYVNNLCRRCQAPMQYTQGLNYVKNEGNNDTWRVTGIGSATDKNIVIPYTYQNKSVTSIGNAAFKDNGDLTGIAIPNSVTSIGSEAFRNCSSLTSITIPDSVTKIDIYAFDGCSGLESVTIGKSITSIGEGMFAGCSGLTNITIPDSVTDIGNSAFHKCSGLTGALKIPDSVKRIDRYAFEDCNGLESVTIGNSVTSIGERAFRRCNSLTSVTIGNSVTTFGNEAFKECYRLAEVYNKSNLKITKGDNKNGFVAYYALNLFTPQEGASKPITENNGFVIYNGNTLLNYVGTQTEITIPDSITEINRYAFYKCSNMTSVTIPNSVTSIGNNAFKYCTGLTSLTFENTEGWQVSLNGNMNNPTAIPATDLAGPAKTATYLRQTYSDYYWKRG